MTLFENFNMTNQTIPVYARHDNFVTGSRLQECSLVNNLAYVDRCNYVARTDDCKGNINFFDYIQFLYCTVDARNEFVHYLAVVFLLVLCCYMFTILGTTADKFFCPALTVLSKKLKMSENVAGVTLLAFGNGSPDLFTAAAYIHSDIGMLYSELFGAGCFITGVIAGSIVFIRPFKIVPSSFLRDAFFYILACVWIDYIMYDNYVNYGESIATIFIYILYLLVVFIDQIIVSRAAERAKNKMVEIERRGTMGQEKIMTMLGEIREQGILDIKTKKSEMSIDIRLTFTASFQGQTKNDNLLEQFLHSINPIEPDDWNESGNFMKIAILLKVPVVLLLHFVIPIVDYNEKAHGWSKLLNVIHVLTMPIYCIITNNYYDAKLYGLSICFWCFLITIPLAALVFYTSRTDQPPSYHFCFAIGAMIASISTISAFANEVVNVLETIGVVSKLSKSFLGSTVLAWGNSVGDLFANIALARQGYQRMGFAACYGGPLFNTCLGLGIVFILKVYYSKNGRAKVRGGLLGPTCTVFLFFILTFTVVALSLTNFAARKSIGIFMFLMYGLFLLYTILGEFEIIHPYGTDHSTDG